MLQFGHPGVYRKLPASAVVILLRQALKRGFARSPGDEVLEGLLMPYTREVGKLSLIRNAAALNTNLMAWDIPGAHLICIKEARHFVMLDRPEEVAQHLSAFLGFSEG